MYVTNYETVIYLERTNSKCRDCYKQNKRL